MKDYKLVVEFYKPEESLLLVKIVKQAKEITKTEEYDPRLYLTRTTENFDIISDNSMEIQYSTLFIKGNRDYKKKTTTRMIHIWGEDKINEFIRNATQAIDAVNGKPGGATVKRVLVCNG